MSASTSLLTRVGSAWYSAWARSGGLPAFAAVSSLVTSSSPWAWLLASTWMLGLAAFQFATTLSMFGTQDQKVRVDLLVRVGRAVAAAGAGRQRRTPASSDGRVFSSVESHCALRGRGREMSVRLRGCERSQCAITLEHVSSHSRSCCWTTAIDAAQDAVSAPNHCAP